MQTTLPLYNFLQVVDKRNVIFKDKLNEIFQGSGQSLGGEARPSRLVPSNLKHGGTGSSAVRTNSARHKFTMAVEQEDGEVKLDVETELPCSCLIVVLMVFKHIKTSQATLSNMKPKTLKHFYELKSAKNNLFVHKTFLRCDL